MSTDYFHRITAETQTRLWINNPTLDEADLAIAAGAINCTTNPAFCARLFDVAPDYMRDITASVAPGHAADAQSAAEAVYNAAARALIERFWPLYERSNGAEGFVTIQGDPSMDDDADYIVDEALRHVKAGGPSVMAKIPVTIAGSEAIEALVQRNVPMCATEVFGLSQALYICDAYQRATRTTGNRPPFFVTHITGIFDEYLAGYVKSNGVEIAPDTLAQAGWAVAHKEYRVLKERGYGVTMLGGGARGLHHFADMVGGDMHITINWSTAKALLEADGPVVSVVDRQASADVVEELAAKLPDFRKAYYEDALAPEEYKDFGPLVLFRNSFLKGYARLMAECGQYLGVSSPAAG